MKTVEKIGIGAGIIVLLSALVLHASIALETYDQTEVFLGEISEEDDLTSDVVTVSMEAPLRLLVRVTVTSQSATSLSLSQGYELFFKYTVSSKDGQRLFSDSVLLEKQPTDTKDDRPENIFVDTHFLKPFETSQVGSIKVSCKAGAWSSKRLDLKNVRVSLIDNAASYGGRLFLLLWLVFVGGLFVIGSLVLSRFRTRNGTDLPSKPEAEVQKIRKRSPALHWILLPLTLWIYGIVWVFLLARDAERITGRKVFSIKWNALGLGAAWCGWYIFAIVPALFGLAGGLPGVELVLSIVAPAYFSVLIVKLGKVLRQEGDAGLPSSFLLVVLTVFGMFSLPLLQWHMNKNTYAKGSMDKGEWTKGTYRRKH